MSKALVLCFFLLPVLWGMGYGTGGKKRKSASWFYIQGVVLLIFVECVIFHVGWHMGWTFKVQEMLLCTVSGAYSVWSVWKLRNNYRAIQRYDDKWYTVAGIGIVVLCLLVVQMQGYLYIAAADQNDVTVEAVNTILTNPMYYLIDPYTGTAAEITGCEYTYSPLLLFYASLCKITGMSAANLVHVIIPFWLLCVSSAAWYQFGLTIWNNRIKAMALIVVIGVLNLFGANQGWLISGNLLFSGWRAETMDGGVLLPFVLLQIAELKKSAVSWKQIVMLVISCLSIVALSKFGIYYTVILAIMIGIIWSVNKTYGHDKVD